MASDYQEAKNINTVGSDIYPNTRFLSTRFTAVNGPTVTWIQPPAHVCALKSERLVVVAGLDEEGEERRVSRQRRAGRH